MILIAVLDVLQDLQRLLIRGRLHQHLLESALQGTVLLDGVTILVERSGTDTLDRTPCQRRFHDVRSIHRTRRGTRSDDCVNLVDKHDHIRIGLQFLHQGFQAFLKLAAILRTSHHTRHVEGIDTLAEKHRTRMVGVDQLCQSFHDGTLSHTRLTY